MMQIPFKVTIFLVSLIPYQPANAAVYKFSQSSFDNDISVEGTFETESTSGLAQITRAMIKFAGLHENSFNVPPLGSVEITLKNEDIKYNLDSKEISIDFNDTVLNVKDTNPFTTTWLLTELSFLYKANNAGSIFGVSCSEEGSLRFPPTACSSNSNTFKQFELKSIEPMTVTVVTQHTPLPGAAGLFAFGISLIGWFKHKLASRADLCCRYHLSVSIANGKY